MEVPTTTVGPTELHDEFRKRIEPFFHYPSTAEFYEMMHPGYKCPCQSVADFAKAATEQPDVEVEIPDDKPNSSSGR